MKQSNIREPAEGHRRSKPEKLDEVLEASLESSRERPAFLDSYTWAQSGAHSGETRPEGKNWEELTAVNEIVVGRWQH